jgi:hypothetical protein
MSDKPSYLGLLNAISVAEGDAHCYLTAWADVTPSSDVQAILTAVAHREGEHSASFAKRINELGFTVLPKDNPKLEEQMAIAKSNRSDLEKMELLGLGRPDSGSDVFDGMFNDHSIDIGTGQLLGRYIAEERDSGRLLRSCYEQLKAGVGRDASSGASSEQIAALDDKVDGLCRAVEDLRQIVCAQTMAPAEASSKRK